jgi:hypothetical protein
MVQRDRATMVAEDIGQVLVIMPVVEVAALLLLALMVVDQEAVRSVVPVVLVALPV